MKKRMLVTAGPTHEPIDRVRYLANRSSGATGVAIAQAAARAGYEVMLLLGPATATEPPEAPEVKIAGDIRVERFESTADLQRLLDEHFEECDVLVMAAAVADYRPRPRKLEEKIERSATGLTLELESTPDLVAGCAKRKRADQRVIAFALEESAKLAERAKAKLARKGVDAIVANPLETMGAPGINATVYTADGAAHHAGAMSKGDFAAWLVGWIGKNWD